ncbi:MAG: hypothetical protein H6754_05120 [Candidatus Omnitrophica bacterium]|nr:hypothetical protein [Candidatus Omnitrophota bacterium]
MHLHSQSESHGIVPLTVKQLPVQLHCAYSFVQIYPVDPAGNDDGHATDLAVQEA